MVNAKQYFWTPSLLRVVCLCKPILCTVEVILRFSKHEKKKNIVLGQVSLGGNVSTMFKFFTVSTSLTRILAH